MESAELFGKTFECECGRTHRIMPREVVYADDALEQLPGVCARATRGRRVAVLMDVRTRRVAGAQAVEVLRTAGWEVAELVVEDPAPAAWPSCPAVVSLSGSHLLAGSGCSRGGTFGTPVGMPAASSCVFFCL